MNAAQHLLMLHGHMVRNCLSHAAMHARGILQVSAPRRTPLRVQNLRVNNVEIPNGKRIEISLQYIYGIGQTTAQKILIDTVRCTN